MKRLSLVVFASLVVACGLVFTAHSEDAYACVPSTQNWCNEPERIARQNCGGNAAGAMWFNRSGGAYFTGTVNVGWNETSVGVGLRGSAWPCNAAWSGGVWAVEIRPDGGNAWRLTNLSSTTLYRGNYQGGNVWSTQGGTVNATLSLSGIPVNNSTSSVTHSMTIDLWRCYSNNGLYRTGTCYATPVPITIVRAGRPITWNLTPTTSITSSTNQPGQTVTWRHQIKNNGPDTTNKTITYRAQNQGHLGTANANTWTTSGITNGATRQQNSTRVITQNDVDKSLCRRTTVSPRSSTDSATASSANSCVYIPYNYTLTPMITVPSDGQVVDGDRVPVSVTGRITNSGPTKSHPDITYQITQLEYAPSVTPPQKNGGVGSDPCAFFTSEQTCRSLSSGSEVSGFNQNQARSYSTTGNRDEKPTGTKICFAISVQRNSSASAVWRHSSLSCQIVGKSPKVQIHGGSLQVGRAFSGAMKMSNVATSVTTLQGVYIPPTEEELRQRAARTQGEWYFGDRARLSFVWNSDATAISSVNRSLAPSVMQGDEGTTVATDGNGVVQFYTDGLDVRDRNGTIMTNGDDIGGSKTTTQAAAVFPLSDDRYMIVTSSARTEDDLLGNLRYSIVDMSQSKVISKNQALGPQGGVYRIGEAISVAPDGANSGYWVVTNQPGTTTIRAFHIPYTWNGLNGGLITPQNSTGSLVSGKASGQFAPGFGTINFNTDYTKMVITMRQETDSGTIRVLDFNKTTGKFTETHAWTVPGRSVYSGDFSPDSNYVYFTSLYNTGPGGGYGNLHRYKISDQPVSSSASKAGRLVFNIATGTNGIGGCGTSGGGGQVKRGPDGKMYVANNGCSSIGVIRNPNATTNTNAAIGWSVSGQALDPGSKSRFGLPQVAAVLRVGPGTYQARTFGSFSEYSIFAPRDIDGMASRSGLNGGVTSSNQSAWSALSFTKRPGTNGYGSYATTRQTLPNVEAAFPITASTPRITIPAGGAAIPTADGLTRFNPAATGSVVAVSGTGPVTIIGSPANSTVKKGRWAVLNAPNHDVTIASNITYEDTPSLANVNDIPQLIIIARNITINSSVTEVNAWLIAKNTLSTCNDQGTAPVLNGVSRSTYETNAAYALTSAICDKALRVNGPVIADKLFLRRTHGSETSDPGLPAEIFNLRPDAYLWAQNRMTNKKIYKTSQVTEVPPRY